MVHLGHTLLGAGPGSVSAGADCRNDAECEMPGRCRAAAVQLVHHDRLFALGQASCMLSRCGLGPAGALSSALASCTISSRTGRAGSPTQSDKDHSSAGRETRAHP